jgi:chromosome segregation ATPase
MSKVLESEMERELEQLMNKNYSLTEENQKLKEKLDTLQGEHKALSEELQRNVTQLQASAPKNNEDLKRLKKRIAAIEADNQRLRKQISDKEQELERVSQHYNKTLEELAMAGTELDALKNSSQERTRRLQERVRELLEELEVTRKMQAQAAILEFEKPHPEPKSPNDSGLMPSNYKDPLELIDNLMLSVSSHITNYKKLYKLSC